jgi:hypothetical protein
MYLTKKHLPRRTFLKGAGATLALPFLSAMVPAATALAKTAANVKPRMGFFYLPHGAIMNNTPYGTEVDAWTPEKVGADFDLKPILAPMKPFQKYMTVISGLDNKPAVSPAVHAITPGTWLSCVHPEENQSPHGGITADQIAARYIGQDTPLPSIEVATEGHGGGGVCDSKFGCGFSGTISFRTPTTPLPMEDNPRKLFERLFGRGDTPQERQEIADDYTSILDFVSLQAKDLKRDLGAQDRAILDDYMDNVREIERRVAKLEEQDFSTVKLPKMPVGIPNFPQHLDLMFDLIHIAYQAELTRISTFTMVHEVSSQTYNHIGVPDAFHPLSHHGNDREALAKLTKIQAFHSEAFVKFLKKLAASPEGDGTMLDNAIFLYGSNMSNSDHHDHFPLPTLVMGGGCGKLKGNQHIKCEDHTPLANVLLTLLDRAGVPAEKIGDSSGMLTEL